MVRIWDNYVIFHPNQTGSTVLIAAGLLCDARRMLLWLIFTQFHSILQGSPLATGDRWWPVVPRPKRTDGVGEVTSEVAITNLCRFSGCLWNRKRNLWKAMESYGKLGLWCVKSGEFQLPWLSHWSLESLPFFFFWPGHVWFHPLHPEWLGRYLKGWGMGLSSVPTTLSWDNLW